MREKEIEKYLKEQVKAFGGLAYKWVSPGQRGVPDQIVFWPGEYIDFIEVKRPGETPTKQQDRLHDRLREFGFRVYVFDNFSIIDKYVRGEL